MPLVKRILEEELVGTQIFAIGDVHGCVDTLLKLENKIRSRCQALQKKPYIVMMGDLCDRGPKSRDVMEHVAVGCEQGTHWCLLGNHEYYFLQFIEHSIHESRVNLALEWPVWFVSLRDSFQSGRSVPTSSDELSHYVEKVWQHWLRNGGTTCLQSYGSSGHLKDLAHAVPERHIRFLANCSIVLESPYGVITHALADEHSLKILKFDHESKLMDRVSILSAVEFCLWNRKMPNSPPVEDLWHFSGHTPIPRVRKNVGKRIFQIDTGCVYGGRLTAIDIQNRKTLSVPCKDKVS